MAEIRQDIIDALIDHIDKAIKKGSVTNQEVAAVLDFLNERLRSFSLEGLEKIFLRKDQPDATNFLLRLLAGAEFGTFDPNILTGTGAAIDADGEALLHSLKVRLDAYIQKNLQVQGQILTDHLQNKTFTAGALGSGMRVHVDANTGQSYAEFDNLLVRREAVFNKLTIAEIKGVGGAILLSLADMAVTKVDAGASTWKCYFNNDDGAILNYFAAGDQAICRKFTGKNIKYYWALVVAVGADYIELSMTDKDGSGIPEEGDEILQLGNRNDVGRQSAILLSAYGSGTPSIRQYAGINSYDLTGKEITVLSPEGNKITGDLIVQSSGKNVSDIQVTAEQAQTSASSAQSTANSAASAAGTAQTTANQAKTDAASAQSTANTANTAAGAAQTAAAQAKTDAANAQAAANAAKSDAASAASAASSAQTAANTANSLLTDIANDNKLTANEKQETKKEWDAIVSEYSKNTAQAGKFGISTTAYTTAYNALNSYITPLLSNLSATSDIVGSTFRATFKAYYDARTDLLNAISVKAKELADTAQSAANSAQATANAANQAAQDAQAAVTVVRSEVQSNFTVLSGQISSKVSQSDFNALGTRVSSAESTINQLPGQITLAVTESKTFATNAVNAVQIGGRNYLRNSRLDNLGGWDSAGEGTKKLVTDSKFGTVVEWTRVSGSGNFQKTFAISDKTALANTDVVFFVIAKGSGAWTFGGWSETYSKLSSASNKIDLGDGWYQYWATFKSGESIASGIFGINTISGTWQFYAVGVLKGNKPTDWSPAPEDVTAEATSLATAAKDAAIVDAASKYTTKTEFSTSITQLSNSISLKASQTDVSALSSRVSSAEAKITPDAINLTVKAQTESIANTASANAAKRTDVTIDATALDASKYYPIRIPVSMTNPYTITVHRALNTSDGVPAWSTHQSGFSVMCKWTSNGAGWGTIAVKRTIHSFAYSWTNGLPIGSIGQMTNSSFEYIYVRGGSRYYVTVEGATGVAVLLLTSSYTYNNQTIDILTSVSAPVVDLEVRPTREEITTQFTMDSTGISMLGKKIALTGLVTFSSLATDAQSQITTAQSTANNAVSAAGTAQTAANNAANAASTAQSTANSATSAANAANQAALDAKASSVPREQYSLSYHYYSAVILLVPYWIDGYPMLGESEVIGELTFRRGGSSASNRTERIDIAAKSAYSGLDVSMSKTGVSWNWRTVRCLYNGVWWLALQSGSNVQDARWEFWGRRTCMNGNGYSSADQFKVIAYRKDYDPGGGNGVLNAEVNDSITTVTAGVLRNADGTAFENVTDSQNKANTARDIARDNVALRLGYASYADMEAKAVAGQTIINGGYIRTSLIDAEALITNQLLANKISATDITTGRIAITNGAKIGNFSVGGNAIYCDTVLSDGWTRNVFISDFNIKIGLQKNGYAREVTLNPQTAYQYPVASIRSSYPDTQSIALSVDARNGTIENVAIQMQGGYISGFCIAAQRITASTTLYHKDCFVTCANTSTISVYLPSAPEKGKVIYLKTTGSAVTLYGNGKSIRFNSSTLNTSISLAGDYWMYMFVYDGVYWEVCRFKS